MDQNQAKISWEQLLARVDRRAGTVELSGLSGSAVTFALDRIYRKTGRPMLVILPTPKAAEQLVEEMAFFLRDLLSDIFYFPSYNLLPHKLVAYHNETAARRISTLYRLGESRRPPVVVTTAGALMKRLPPRSQIGQFCELLMAGEETDRDQLVRKLISGGYTRAAIVEEPGDFGLRGGILDIYTPLYEDPLRIEFFGDYVESIRLFNADSQRTHRSLDEVVLLPAREAILPPGEVNRVLGRIRALAADISMPAAAIRELAARIKDEGSIPGMESLLPLIYEGLDTLFDYLPGHCLAVMIEPGELAGSAMDLELQIRKSYQASCDQRQLCVDPSALYMEWPAILNKLAEYSLLTVKALHVDSAEAVPEQIARCVVTIDDLTYLGRSMQAAMPSGSALLPLADWLAQQGAAARTTLIVCRRVSHVQRIREILEPYGLRPVIIDNLSQVSSGKGGLYLISGEIAQGFSWVDAGMNIISDEDLFGTHYQQRRRVSRSAVTELLNIEDLKQGDLVVHTEHGIGRYEGLVKLTIDRAVNDYLLIIYRDDDKLYMPVERMNLVQKYMGTEGIAPVLDKMGGATWERVKRMVKRSTEKIAGELLKLYAARKVQQGHAFGEVDTYFHDFEEGFPYEETADQHKAIEDVLHDMRRPLPMDRLVCGDVGYGKTEVALRAAFLAASEAKQVAVLVPTTVLAEQHFANFSERFKRFPVKIAALNRFRSAREQRDIAAGLKEGTIDIVIGTHRLLQKDVEFKDLGLLIMDEEQRFGVRHKEKIKRLRQNVDVLTLTATPIPRTLHFSLMGIRDISLISTPPEQRRPIATYVSEFDDTLVAEAIRKELSRNGQIFFVHNNILGIERMAQRLAKLVPEARLAVAHGRMEEEQLEKVMLDFMHKRIDLLVCTTIIESGLDVSAANTIFINRADLFGLAQIYQLRGRVGRSDEQAYAYLFIPGETTLTKDAQKRLKVLMQYSDLGSGFHIAMSDLKIRGGGTILGASQSGHVAAVGYDMFLKLMESSVAELKGEPLLEALEPEINLPLAAFLPEEYIADIDQRLSVYRRLARMTDLKAISDLKAELEDRYGKLPDEAGNLLLKIMLKVLAAKAGCKRLDLNETLLQLQFSEAHQQNPGAMEQMARAARDIYQWTADRVFKVRLVAGPPKTLLAQAKNILIEIGRRVNQ